MVIVWLFEIALTVLEWFFSLFEALPSLDLPSSVAVTIPVPFLGGDGTAMMNAWLGVAVLVVIALVIGKVLQWLYSLIPFKMT